MSEFLSYLDGSLTVSAVSAATVTTLATIGSKTVEQCFISFAPKLIVAGINNNNNNNNRNRNSGSELRDSSDSGAEPTKSQWRQRLAVLGIAWSSGLILGVVLRSSLHIARDPPSLRWVKSLYNLVRHKNELALGRKNGDLSAAEFLFESAEDIPHHHGSGGLTNRKYWWHLLKKESDFVLEKLQEKGLEKYLAGPIEGNHQKLLPSQQPNDGGLLMIGSTSIKDVELATPWLDVALRLNCSPWKLPPEFQVVMRELGYVSNGAAIHNINGEDWWWVRVRPEHENNSPDPNWPHWRTNRFFEKHHGFALHVVGPRCHQWVYDGLAFCRFIEQNADAREKYMAVKRKHASASQKGVVPEGWKYTEAPKRNTYSYYPRYAEDSASVSEFKDGNLEKIAAEGRRQEGQQQLEENRRMKNTQPRPHHLASTLAESPVSPSTTATDPALYIPGHKKMEWYKRDKTKVLMPLRREAAAYAKKHILS